MTTVEAEHQFAVQCRGKSCRQLYFEACTDSGVVFNKALMLALPAVADQFTMRELVMDNKNYLGVVGVAPLTSLIRANKLLVRIGLHSQGVTDDAVAGLVEAVRGHERLEHIDFSGNADITDESANVLCALLLRSRSICEITVEGTGLSKCVRRQISRLGARNAAVEVEFFKENLLAHKRLFMELDVDGSGTVTYQALLDHLALPQVSAVIDRKMAEMENAGGGIARGSTLQVDDFLHLVHPNFRCMSELEAFMKLDDTTESTIVANWGLLAEHFSRTRVAFTALHTVRIRSSILSKAQAEAIVKMSLELAGSHLGTEDAAAAAGSAAGGGDSALVLPPDIIVAAAKCVVGEEERQFDERVVRGVWKGAKLSPSLVRTLNALFLNRASFLTATARLPEAPLQFLLDVPLRTQTVALLSRRVLPKLLRRFGMDPTISVTFPQLLAFMEEHYEALFYPISNLA